VFVITLGNAPETLKLTIAAVDDICGPSRQSWRAMPLDMMECTVHGHRFKVGQSVSLMSGLFGRGGTNGLYKVTQLLPPQGDDYQYRIKNTDEPHERVVKESQLSRVA
jgi:hypothetical protein